MAENADLECSGQKGGQDMFLRIRLYKILIANGISEAVNDTVAGRVYLWIDDYDLLLIWHNTGKSCWKSMVFALHMCIVYHQFLKWHSR